MRFARLIAFLVLVTAVAAGQAIRIDDDDNGVNAEDAFEAVQVANAEQETARVVAFAEAILTARGGR